MNPFWLFVTLFLVQLAVQFSLACCRKCDPMPYTQKTWTFTTACWLLALCVSAYHNGKSVPDRTETACKTIMAAVRLDPGNPALSQVANGIYYDLPKSTNGKYQQELRQYVQGVARSWDNCKELQRKEG